jgi:Rap1a immunity proteins
VFGHASAVVAVLGLVAATPSSAQVLINAADLTAECRHKRPEPDYYHCAGYLTGVLQTLQVGMSIRKNAQGEALVAETTNGFGTLCLAAQMIPDDLAKEFVAFIELHPEKQKESPLVVAAEALIALDYAPPPTLVAARTWERCGRKKTP